jgi:hypothetical protein
MESVYSIAAGGIELIARTTRLARMTALLRVHMLLVATDEVVALCALR